MTPATQGRMAGWVYLVVIITGIFSLMIVPSRVPGTLIGVQSHAMLYGAGIAGFAVEQIAFALLACLLYRIFAPRRTYAARLMLGLVLVAVALGFVAVAHRTEALMAALSPSTDAGLRLQSALAAYRHDLVLTSLFWGLWLLPFGQIAWLERALPRVIAGLLLLGGLSYIADVACTWWIPDYANSAISDYLTLPAAIAEIATCFWLLIFGIRQGVTL